MSKNYDIKAIIFLIVLTLGFRLWMLFLFDNYLVGDGTARLYFSYYWYLYPQFSPSVDWLPLPFYLIGTLFFFEESGLYLPRILMITFSTLTIIPLYLSVKKVFNQKIALGTGIAFALLGMNAVYSTTTLSLPIFIFFFYGTLWSVLRFLEESSYKNALHLVFFISCMNLVRFEGWFFTFLIGIYLLLQQVPTKQFLTWSLLSALAPLWVMYLAWRTTGDPLRGINYSDKEVIDYLTMHPVPWIQAWHQIERALAVPLVILSFFSFRLWYKDQYWRCYLFLTLSFLSILVYKLVDLTLIPVGRYFVLVGILLIPYGLMSSEKLVVLVERFIYYIKILLQALILGIVFLSKKIWDGLIYIGFLIKKPWDGLKPYAIIIAAFALTFPTTREWVLLGLDEQINHSSRFKEGFMESAYWVKKNLKPMDKLSVDWDDWSETAWYVYAGSFVNADFYQNNTPEDRPGVVCPARNHFWVEEATTADSFFKCLETEKPNYLVLFKDGLLDKALGFENEEEIHKTWTFTRQFLKNGFKIYRIEQR